MNVDMIIELLNFVG